MLLNNSPPIREHTGRDCLSRYLNGKGYAMCLHKCSLTSVSKERKLLYLICSLFLWKQLMTYHVFTLLPVIYKRDTYEHTWAYIHRYIHLLCPWQHTFTCLVASVLIYIHLSISTHISVLQCYCMLLDILSPSVFSAFLFFCQNCPSSAFQECFVKLLQLNSRLNLIILLILTEEVTCRGNWDFFQSVVHLLWLCSLKNSFISRLSYCFCVYHPLPFLSVSLFQASLRSPAPLSPQCS